MLYGYKLSLPKSNLEATTTPVTFAEQRFQLFKTDHQLMQQEHNESVKSDRLE